LRTAKPEKKAGRLYGFFEDLGGKHAKEPEGSEKTETVQRLH